MINTHPEFETGCYLDNHRGHYISRDVVEFAVAYGFIVGLSDAYVIARYDAAHDDDDYPHEVVHELADEATAWLNSSPTNREIHGQNMPPARPANAYWGFNDGDYGLYVEDDEDACPDCGRPITLQPTGWWSHDGMPNGCWRLSMDGPATDE